MEVKNICRNCWHITRFETKKESWFKKAIDAVVDMVILLSLLAFPAFLFWLGC